MSFLVNFLFFQYNIKHLIFVCVNKLVYMLPCTQVHECGGVRMCTRGNQRSPLGVVPRELSAMFSETKSLTRTWSSQRRWRGCQEWGSTCLCLPSEDN